MLKILRLNVFLLLTVFLSCIGDAHAQTQAYLDNLKAYKLTNHQLTGGYFRTWRDSAAKDPEGYATSFRMLPDSLDFVFIFGGEIKSSSGFRDSLRLKYVPYLHARGTKIIYTGPINFPENSSYTHDSAGYAAFAKFQVDSFMNYFDLDGYDVDVEDSETGQVLADRVGIYKALSKYLGPASGTGKLLTFDTNLDGSNLFFRQCYQLMDFVFLQAYGRSTANLTATYNTFAPYIPPGKFIPGFSFYEERGFNWGDVTYPDADNNRCYDYARWQPTQGTKGGVFSYALDRDVPVKTDNLIPADYHVTRKIISQIMNPPPTAPGTAGNYSLSFNGTNQFVNAGTINLSGSSITMEAWVKAAAFKTGSPYISTVMGTEVGANNTALLRFGDGVLATNNKLQFVISNGTSQVKLMSASSFNTNTWYHIAATYDGATMKIYVNGVLDASFATSSVLTANGAFYLGYSYDGNRNFNGQLDEAKVWKKALTVSEIQSGRCSVSPASASLEAYWRLNDGGLIANDTTGHGHTGTLVNMTNSNWNTNINSTCVTTAPANYSLAFNGTSQYLSSNTVNLSGSTISMEGWVKANAFKTTSPYISTVMGIEGAGGSALLRFGDANIPAGNKLQFVLTIGSSQAKLVSTTVFNTATWYHIAATYDGATMKIYVNGVLDASVAQTGSVTANGTFNIGYSYETKRIWNGNMDELRVWKKVLTQAEIQSNRCTVPATSASLEGYWKMNEGTGTTTADASNHGHTGTFVNMTAANWNTNLSSACGGTASRTQNLFEQDPPAAIRYVGVWPNPVVRGENLIVSLPDLSSPAILRVYSMNGTILSATRIANKQSILNTAVLPAGVYFYNINNEKGSLIRKGKFVVL